MIDLLEIWRISGHQPGLRIDVVDIELNLRGLDLERAKVIGASLAMLRVLLTNEWVVVGETFSGKCPECDVEADEEYGNYTHEAACSINAALTLAGFATKERRDEARRRIAEAGR